MKRFQVLLFLAALLIAALLAWLISDFVHQSLIFPALEFGWLVQNYFKMIPQASLWGIVIAILLFSAFSSLAAAHTAMPKIRKRTQNAQTPGRELAFWLARVQHGPYQRWFIARHLANLAIEILREKGAQIERGGTLTGPGWNPPEDIQKYLQAAMFSSPKTFGPAAKATGLKSDPDVKEVIEYLETYVEASNEY